MFLMLKKNLMFEIQFFDTSEQRDAWAESLLKNSCADFIAASGPEEIDDLMKSPRFARLIKTHPFFKVVQFTSNTGSDAFDFVDITAHFIG